MKPKTIIVAVLIILCLILLLQNTQVVTLRIFFWKASISRIFLLPVLVLMGFIVGYVTAKLGEKPKKESRDIENKDSKGSMDDASD
jgi:uncharacterized integral membrane protein